MNLQSNERPSCHRALGRSVKTINLHFYILLPFKGWMCFLLYGVFFSRGVAELVWGQQGGGVIVLMPSLCLSFREDKCVLRVCSSALLSQNSTKLRWLSSVPHSFGAVGRSFLRVSDLSVHPFHIRVPREFVGDQFSGLVAEMIRAGPFELEVSLRSK